MWDAAEALYLASKCLCSHDTIQYHYTPSFHYKRNTSINCMGGQHAGVLTVGGEFY